MSLECDSKPFKTEKPVDSVNPWLDGAHLGSWNKAIDLWQDRWHDLARKANCRNAQWVNVDSFSFTDQNGPNMLQVRRTLGLISFDFFLILLFPVSLILFSCASSLCPTPELLCHKAVEVKQWCLIYKDCKLAHIHSKAKARSPYPSIIRPPNIAQTECMSDIEWHYFWLCTSLSAFLHGPIRLKEPWTWT